MSSPKKTQTPESVGIFHYIANIGEPMVINMCYNTVVEKLTFKATNLIASINRNQIFTAMRGGEDAVTIDSYNQMEDAIRRNEEGLTESGEFSDESGFQQRPDMELMLEAICRTRRAFIVDRNSVRSGLENQKMHSVIEDDLFSMAERCRKQYSYLLDNEDPTIKDDCRTIGCTPAALKRERGGKNPASHFAVVVQPQVMDYFAKFYQDGDTASLDTLFETMDVETRHFAVNQIYSSLKYLTNFKQVGLLTGKSWYPARDREDIPVLQRETELLRPFIDAYLDLGTEELTPFSELNVKPTEDIDKAVEKKKEIDEAIRELARKRGLEAMNAQNGTSIPLAEEHRNPSELNDNLGAMNVVQ